MREMYEKIEDLAKEVNERFDEVKKDKYSVIIGLADDEKIITLCIMGDVVSIVQMTEIVTHQVEKKVFRNLLQ